MKLLLLALSCLLSNAAAAIDLGGRRSVTLLGNTGERVEIAKIVFTPVESGRYRFELLPDPRLEEFFLAMRPFRCVTGPQQRLCHFPVEREAPVIGPDDLVPLEYALMFMRTAPNALHVNPFNGVYYRLRMSDRGIEGELHEVDMDPFITPDSVPPARRQRPLRPQDLSAGDPASHWLPRLIID